MGGDIKDMSELMDGLFEGIKWGLLMGFGVWGIPWLVTQAVRFFKSITSS